MKKNSRSILWITAVVIASAALLSLLDRMEEDRAGELSFSPPTMEVFLIGYEDEEFPGKSEDDAFVRIGCNDALIPYRIPVSSSRLKSVLNALSLFDPPAGLHNPFRDQGLSIGDVQKDVRDVVFIDFEGNPQFGGRCDRPRFRGQLEYTIRLYEEDFEISLNGSAEEYRCLRDVHGRCE